MPSRLNDAGLYESVHIRGSYASSRRPHFNYFPFQLMAQCTRKFQQFHLRTLWKCLNMHAIAQCGQGRSFQQNTSRTGRQTGRRTNCSTCSLCTSWCTSQSTNGLRPIAKYEPTLSLCRWASNCMNGHQTNSSVCVMRNTWCTLWSFIITQQMDNVALSCLFAMANVTMHCRDGICRSGLWESLTHSH